MQATLQQLQDVAGMVAKRNTYRIWRETWKNGPLGRSRRRRI